MENLNITTFRIEKEQMRPSMTLIGNNCENRISRKQRRHIKHVEHDIKQIVDTTGVKHKHLLS